MKKIEDIHILLKKEFELPQSKLLRGAIRSFSATEKIIFGIFIAIFAASAFFLAFKVNRAFIVEVPSHGGHLNEGILGSPRFINPLLALSDADRDLTSLVYSGLLKATPGGELIPDLAESYSISEDGKIYTFILRENLTFHDGEPVTTDDVEFTVLKAQDAYLKSPKRASWDGVVVEKVSAREISFKLKQPYSPFLENATIGILPKHIWSDADPEQFPHSLFNTEPIGSGPYRVAKIKRNASGIPEYYELSSFKGYSLGEPYITSIVIKFYANEKNLLHAYRSGAVESVNSIAPEEAALLAEAGYSIRESPLPRVFGVFFNQNQATVFKNKEVRKALSLALDRDRIVSEVLLGYGVTIESPIPPGLIGDSIEKSQAPIDRIEEARAVLTASGWKFNEEKGVFEKRSGKETSVLQFSISTSDAPELKRTAELIKQDWERLGAKVELKIFNTGDLNQNVIRPRKYDSLLFGEIVGRDLDFFAFWHSSQRNDPGLNIALYTNITVDKLLEEARVRSDRFEREGRYKKFEKEVMQEVPAVFVYSPNFIYAVPTKIKNVTLGHAITPSERFLSVHQWFIETDHVWKIFTKKEN